MLLNNHTSKYNSFILVLYRRYKNHVSVCPPHFLAHCYATELVLNKTCCELNPSDSVIPDVIYKIIIIILIIISHCVIRVGYRQDVINKFVRKIMALSFLPDQYIQSMIVRIESLLPPNGKMCEMFNCICQR